MLDGILDWFASAWDWVTHVGDSAIGMADSGWVLVALFAFVTIDGFFPPVPSETLVIALASLSMTGDGPPLWAIVPIAAVGAFLGDIIAYTIGARVPLRTMRWFRSARGARMLLWAERQLKFRGGALILSARYIPIGRVAVNMSAGALGFGRRRFLGFAALAAVSWAIYSTLLGIGAGAFLHDQPLLAVVAGIVLGVALGTLIDVLVRRFIGTPHEIPAPVAELTDADAVAAAAESAEGPATDPHAGSRPVS